MKQTLLEILGTSFVKNNGWVYNRICDLYVLVDEDSEYFGFSISKQYNNDIIWVWNGKEETVKPNDENYFLLDEVYKSAKTLYNIMSGNERWNTPSYQYDSKAIDKECRNVFADYYYWFIQILSYQL